MNWNWFKRKTVTKKLAPAEERYVPQIKLFYNEDLKAYGWECRPWCAEEIRYQLHFPTEEEAAKDGNRHADRCHKNNWSEGTCYWEESA